MAKKKTKRPQKETLFKESLVPAKAGSDRLFEVSYDNSQPVECLGMTFPDDDARRKYFLNQLSEKLKDPEFRKIEGFPIGEDDDILALSDPPYYTACPNPFLEDFVSVTTSKKSTNYKRTPFAVDVSEGKTDALYKAHGYHTKVPHLAIIPSILHYTNPGDVVLDGFCGSGMTGVAAHFCALPPEPYRIELEQRWSQAGMAKPNWGIRKTVLNDLSPAATFITTNYTTPFDLDEFERLSKELLANLKTEIGWIYQTLHSDGRTIAQIDYTVWSEVYSCSECSEEVVFLEVAFDRKSKKVRESFPCPHCNVTLKKSKLESKFETRFDKLLGVSVESPKRKPILIAYRLGKKKFEKVPTKEDLEVIQKIEALNAPSFPIKPFPFDDMWEATRLSGRKITHVHHLFLIRQIHALAASWAIAIQCSDVRLRSFLLFFIEQAIWTASVLNRYRPTGYSQVNQYISGVFYVPSQHSECSPWYILGGKSKRLCSTFMRQYASRGTSYTTTGDTGNLPLPPRSIDYIFTDPPFGDNLPYSELNFLVEAFLKVTTDAGPEAVVERAKKNRSKQKGLIEYQRLMERCFTEYYRVLKPGRWITIVFSNSKNSVWTAIQEALARAGFIVADVRTLDKQQQSFKQVTSIAVKQDLVISAYRPTEELENKFQVEAGTPEGVWDFLQTHLGQLPVFVSKGDISTS